MQNSNNSAFFDSFFDRLDPQEKQQLLQVEKEYTGSTNSSVKHWDWLITEVKKGYADMSYEYLNDIASRYTIQRMIDQTQGSLKEKLEALVQKLDEAFLEVTYPISNPVSSYDFIPKNPKKYFWYYRIPKILTKELSIDFDENGRK